MNYLKEYHKKLNKAFSEQFAYATSEVADLTDLAEYVTNGVACFSDDQASYGQFESIENLLKELEIPFNRNSSGYYEYPEEAFSYRPDQKEQEIYQYPSIGDFVDPDKLKNVLNSNKSDSEKLKEISNIVEVSTRGPKPLEEYASQPVIKPKKEAVR